MFVRRLPVHPAISGPLLPGTRELFVTAHFSLLVRGAALSAICWELFQPGRATLLSHSRRYRLGPAALWPLDPCGPPLGLRSGRPASGSFAPAARLRAFTPCSEPTGTLLVPCTIQGKHASPDV